MKHFAAPVLLLVLGCKPSLLPDYIDLGVRSWAAGDFREAEAYWKRGEALAGTAGEAVDSVLWADLAQAALVRGDAKAALDYSDQALGYSGEKLGAVFTRAKAHLARHEDKAALDDFKTGWTTHRSTMAAQDFDLYARTLVAAKNYAFAYEVLETFRDTLPYEPGAGLIESVCLENLGRYDESVLTALVDVDYQRSRGLIAPAQVLQNLGSLETKIAAKGLAPEKSGLTTVRAALAWSRGEFAAVDFDDNLLSASSDARFFRLSAQLQSGRVNDADLKAYAALEHRFHGFASYYLALVRYFRDFRKDTRNEGFAALAEKVVNLASGSEANEGRTALALAWGLSADQGASLLTHAEIDATLPGDPRLLKLLATPDNPAVQHAVTRLQQAAAAGARSLLTSLLASATGRVKERLNLVLQNR